MQQKAAAQRQTQRRKEQFRAGDRVILNDDRMGMVKWIGALDGFEDTPENVVGVHLDEPGQTIVCNWHRQAYVVRGFKFMF